MAAKEEPPRHAFDPRLASVAYWGVVAAQLPVMAGVALFAPTAMNAAWAFCGRLICATKSGPRWSTAATKKGC